MPKFVDASKNYSIYIKELKKKRGVKGKKKKRGGTFRFESEYESGSGGANYPDVPLTHEGYGGSGGGGGGHGEQGGGGA